MENVSDSENDTGTVPLPRLESETETKSILITSEQERDRLYYQEQKRGIEKRLEGLDRRKKLIKAAELC